MPTGIYKRKPLSEEIKKKIGIANSGKKLSEDRKIQIGLSKRGNKYRRGIKLSEEIKDKIRKANKGKTAWNKGLSKETDIRIKMYAKTLKDKGIKPSFKGYNHSEETKKKISELQIGKHCGEKSPSWKGGITPINTKIRTSLEYKKWHRSVLMKDKFTCQKTKKKGGKLTAHHIQNFSHFPEIRFDVTNGITFSEDSHKEFHRIYGRKNNIKEQLINFLK